MAEFSLDLNEDQLQIRKWVHDFAEDVIRPAAPVWDEREETPGRSSRRPPRSASTRWSSLPMRSPTRRVDVPDRTEEMCWGDAGIAMAIFGSILGVTGIAGNGTPEQMAEWVPQCFGTPEKVQLGAFCVSEPDAGSDVSSLRTRAVYDEAKDEWVLNGTKTWITNGGIADVHVVVASVEPELKARGPGELHGAPGHARPRAGSEVQEAWNPRSHTAEVVLEDCAYPGAASSVARRSSTRAGQGREGQSSACRPR